MVLRERQSWFGDEPASAAILEPRIAWGRQLCLTGALSLMLSGCAANILRIESASAVSAASTAVVEASRASIENARLRRTRANAVVIASDPSCPAAQVIHIRTEPGSLCAEVAGPTTVSFDTRPISDAVLDPTLTLIAGLADYSAALAKIVEDPKPDISAEVEALAKKAGEASAIATALTGANLPDLAATLATDQAKAALDLLQFAAELSHESQQVDRIRALVKARDAKVAEITANLAGQIETWNQLARTDAETTALRLATVYNQQARSRPFEQRLGFVEMVNATRDDVTAVTKRTIAMNQAFAELEKARTTLRDRLDGKFSQEDQQRIARENRARIFGALKLLSAAIKVI